MHSWVYCVDVTACEASGYNPRFALLAQLAEQLTLNQRVVGSSPTQGIFRLHAIRVEPDSIEIETEPPESG